MPDLSDSVPVSEPISAGREEESLFARDENDILVRREKETRERFKEEVTVVIDGYSVTIPRAVPKTDSQGNVQRDADGEPIPRTTTIYDAAARLVSQQIWSSDELKTRIPVLCHQQHVTPIAVCRMCSVHISSFKRGKLTPGRKLVPACQHRVEKGMVVTTRAGANGYNPETKSTAEISSVERFAKDVNESVRLLAEFLLADHRHERLGEKRYDDELSAVATALNVSVVRDRLKRDTELPGRNAQSGVDTRSRRISLPLATTTSERETLASKDAETAWREWNETVDADYPYSSRTVVVDHDRCILCDRCARACSEVKPFQVIGHTGKGYGSRISFDLDSIMGQSSCVQCGECMNSCPTGALSLRRRVQPRAWPDSPEQIPLNPNTAFVGSDFLTADEMQSVWLLHTNPKGESRVYFPFQSVPYSYLKWNEGSIRRWEIAPGTRRVLCRQDEYGSSAFLLQGTGQFEIYERDASNAAKPGFLARMFGRSAEDNSEYGTLYRVAKGDELVLGEMSCLNQRPRTATVIAVADRDNPRLQLGHDKNGRPSVIRQAGPHPVIVYEITRNLLDMMQRSASARDDLREIYALRAIQFCVNNGKFFAPLSREDRVRAVKVLFEGNPQYKRVEPGEIIVAEGDMAHAFHIIRLGTVRVFQRVGDRDQVLRLLSNGDYFGEGALLSPRPTSRAASVAAIDPVELVRVPGPVFLELCAMFPQLKESLNVGARPAAPGVEGKPPPGVLTEYARQGLFQGQRLLVLDLKSCTRCDECTRACADSHDHNARLLREGLRFGDFLVATSCRSCHKPYCMEGCPVDAIHRKGDHLEVVIENHCIGCGLCERNCPYGAIHMVAREVPNAAAAALPNGNPLLTAARRAVNCDLCGGNEPFCVQACPHEAAYRMSGPDLMNEVLDRLKKAEE